MAEQATNVFNMSFDDNTNVRFRGYVNNQVGLLSRGIHNYPSEILTLTAESKPWEKPYTFQSYSDTHQQVMVCEDALPVELARQTRDFLNSIPFDANLDYITNETVKDNIPRALTKQDVDEFNDRNKLHPNNDDTTWTWENYNTGIWRVAPLSFQALDNSIVPYFINTVVHKWRNTTFEGRSCNDLIPNTVVIQRSAKGDAIPMHRDDYGERRISFIYYLTPDDWQEEDGGMLHVMNESSTDCIRIVPKFNTMISWSMKHTLAAKLGDGDFSPLHWVSPVKADNDKARIALVGFLWG